MRKFSKPTVFISKCIEQDQCRYDGSMIKSEVVKKMFPYLNVVTACPEMAIGLPAPREALRIVRYEDQSEHILFSQSGQDKTKEMVAFSRNLINELDTKGIDGFILKHRSPSCGMNDVKIYKGIGKSNVIPGKTSGIFGQAVLEGFPDIAVENEGRLRNFNLRESFLIAIFTNRAFKEIKHSAQMKDLVQFHSTNKYLFMALSPGHLKAMGKIVANHEKHPFSKVVSEYEIRLRKTLLQPMNRNRNINVLLHIYGYFKNSLSVEEKAYFLENIELYNQKKVPFSVLLAILRSWVIRFEEPYLMEQTIFEPFPKELFSVTDSGKGL